MQVPEASKEERDRAIGRSLMAYEAASNTSSDEAFVTKQTGGKFLQSLIYSACAVVFGIFIFLNIQHKDQEPNSDNFAQIFNEVRVSFHKHLAAVIVSDKEELNMVLMDEPTQEASEFFDLLVKTEDCHYHIRGVYGKSIEVNLCGNLVEFEALRSLDGKIILVGNNFLYEQGEIQKTPKGFRLKVSHIG